MVCCFCLGEDWLKEARGVMLSGIASETKRCIGNLYRNPNGLENLSAYIDAKIEGPRSSPGDAHHPEIGR